MTRRALRSPTVERLERFKANQPPYGVVAPLQSTAELRDERAAAMEQERLERNRRKRLERAARSLPDVYGEPPGPPSVVASVRLAKMLLADGKSAREALEQSAILCTLPQLVTAVLRMRGAS